MTPLPGQRRIGGVGRWTAPVGSRRWVREGRDGGQWGRRRRGVAARCTNVGERRRAHVVLFGERQGWVPALFFPKSHILRHPRPS
jgi:hypothetical protein